MFSFFYVDKGQANFTCGIPLRCCFRVRESAQAEVVYSLSSASSSLCFCCFLKCQAVIACWVASSSCCRAGAPKVVPKDSLHELS